MSASKSKNIIIIALLLLNLILLGVYIFDRSASARTREAEAEALSRVLSQQDISLSEKVDLSARAPEACTIIRDEEADDRLMKKLVSYNYREDMGGNVIFYSSDYAQAILRGTGEIELIFDSDNPEVGDDSALSISKYMDKKGVEIFSELAVQSGDANGIRLRIPCGVDGYCVFNSGLNFFVSNSKLTMISGTRVFDGTVESDGTETVDSVSAIMYFLEYLRLSELKCGSIDSLEPGYFMNVAVSGECTLRPVWKFITDVGEFYINAVNGRVEELPALNSR